MTAVSEVAVGGQRGGQLEMATEGLRRIDFLAVVSQALVIMIAFVADNDKNGNHDFYHCLWK